MRRTLDTLAQQFIATAEWYAFNCLGEDGRRPMPVEEPELVTREHYNQLVRFVRERLG